MKFSGAVFERPFAVYKRVTIYKSQCGIVRDVNR